VWTAGIATDTYTCVPSGTTCTATKTGTPISGTAVSCCTTSNCNTVSALIVANCLVGNGATAVATACTTSCVVN
jgi:hypothetical protein